MSDNNRPIGIFDSGMGGVSVLKELVKLMPNENYIYYGDSKNAPYGVKTREEIISLCIDICEKMIEENVKAIVVACNTATSAAIAYLREKYKNIPIVGMEPAVKLGAKLSESKNIMVMATPFTLKEAKFNSLIKNYTDSYNIIKMPCPELVGIVERGELSNEALVSKQLYMYFNKVKLDDIDTIVLGCTHFTFYKKYIQDIVGDRVHIIDGNKGTCYNLKNILSNFNILNNNEYSGKVNFLNSSSDIYKIELSKELFKYENK